MRGSARTVGTGCIVGECVGFFATDQVHQGEFNLCDTDAALHWITSAVNGYHYYQDNT